MSRIGKIGFLSALLLSIDLVVPQSACGSCVPKQDTIVVQLSNAIQLLTSQMELVKYNLESMNLNMKLLDSKIIDSKNVYIGLMPDYYEDLEPKTNFHYPKGTQESNKVHDNKSPLNREPKGNRNIENAYPDSCKAYFDTFRQLNETLTANVRKLELWIHEMPILSQENENQSDSINYDKHFNCVGNCNANGSTIPKSCSEATAINDFNDGVYLLNASSPNDLEPFYAYCAHEKANEKGWMIIQRREDGTVNFNRNWLDYKRGFGDLYGEYWIGLDRLHVMTKNQAHEIAILLKDYDGNERSARYSKFSVAGENENYKLGLDCYSGNAGDSFKHHNFMMFSTFDRDNDGNFANCARDYKSGWWYDNCYSCNLNGAHYNSANKNTGNGVNWFEWLGYNYSLKYTHMAIRPA